jgi:group I intron endonuclease
MTSGIYSITNTVNGKIYYGSSNRCEHRWSQHKNQLTTNKHDNRHLQGAWNKYGSSDFVFNIVEEIPIEQLVSVEQQYLDWCKHIPEWFYNLSFDAAVSNRGRKFTPEQIEHHKVLRKKDWALGKYNDRKHSHCKPMLGKHHSLETKRKISEIQQDGRYDGKKNPFYGKFHSKTSKEKISLSLIGSQRRLNKNIYKFIKPETNETFIGRMFDFRKKYKLADSKVSCLVNGKRKSHKGWTLWQ